MRKLLFVLIMLIAPASFANDGDPDEKTVVATKNKTPKIDGMFEDAEWMEGGIATNFIQFEPNELVPSTEKTEAYFQYDAKNLYIGIKMYDSNPANILSEVGSRDRLGSSESVFIYLDTFHDHRNGYVFATNPSGSKYDAKVAEDGFRSDNSWDGIWAVKASVTGYGWIAEFQIPFSTLKFQNKDIQTWGLNILRGIRWKEEDVSWQSIKRNDGLRISKFGHLTGLQGLNRGLDLEILPFVTNRMQKDRVSRFQTNNGNGITGVDIKYGITPNLTSVVTVNPDFAQIEADEDQINLSRYPLYLAEKRPFFVEGGSIFETAGNFPTAKLFYSRRINEPVYGTKMTGKVGKWDVGLVHALNDNDIGMKQKIASGTLSAGIDPQAFYNVIRMNRDVFSRSQVGLIALSKEYKQGYNRKFGLDGIFRFKNYYTFFIESVKSFSDEYTDNGHSLLTELFFRKDKFTYTIDYLEMAPNFTGNDLGIYNYDDYRRGRLNFGYTPRLEHIGIRQLYLYNTVSAENLHGATFTDKSTLQRTWTSFIGFTTMNYWNVTFNKALGKSYDRFDEALYPVDSYNISVSNNSNSMLYVNVGHNQGEYRTGYSWSYSGNVTLKPNDKLNLQLSYDRSLAKLKNSASVMNRYNYEVWRARFYYPFNRDLNTRIIFQYNDMEKRLDTYYLIAWNYKPRSFLYIAYTERYDEDPYYRATGQQVFPGFSSSNKLLQLKLSYMFKM